MRTRYSVLTVLLGLGFVASCSNDDESTAGGAAPQERTDVVETDSGLPPDEEDVVRPVSEITDIVPGAASMRRLTRGQFVASVRAVFGEDLPVLPPTEIDLHAEGLLTVGAREANVTPAGIEGYEATARQVATDALSEERRDQILKCTPASANEPDDECAAELVRAVGPLLLRRLLVDGEEDAYVALARTSTETLGSFYSGLRAVIIALMLNPEFLFIQESTRPVEGETAERLTGVSLASRLSYFFWGRGPDLMLLEAAASGALDTEEGYVAQVERLIADEAKLEAGIRALFTDLYDLDKLPYVEKDRLAFPELTQGALEDAREQTLRTIVDHLLVQGADYRDLFTTTKTFMTRRLGIIYNVPVSEDWEVYEFPEGGARAGILTHVSFLALHARTSRSSPVLRGEFVMDKLLCLTIPPPPADVNFDAVAPGGANAPTARERLLAHRVNPSCSGCHDLLDPIGLALENFDAIGRFRTEENGFDILSYGDVLGVDYADVRSFHTTLRNSPAVSECMVHKLYMHGVGRVTVADEEELLSALTNAFAEQNHGFVPLMKTIALSYGFRAASGPAQVEQEDSE